MLISKKELSSCAFSLIGFCGDVKFLSSRYKNSATGFDSDFPGFCRAEQQSPTPHGDKTSDARQVQNHKRFPLREMQSEAADRYPELAVNYPEPNDRVAGYTSPLQFEELGQCADC